MCTAKHWFFTMRNGLKYKQNHLSKECCHKLHKHANTFTFMAKHTHHLCSARGLVSSNQLTKIINMYIVIRWIFTQNNCGDGWQPVKKKTTNNKLHNRLWGKSTDNDSEISEQSAVYMKKILEFSVKRGWGTKMNFKKNNEQTKQKKKKINENWNILCTRRW